MNKSNQAKNILISACLLGNPVRYNGTDLLLAHPLIKKWQTQQRLISICPEVVGGLPIPRAPAEIQGGNGNQVLTNKITVVDNTGKDVSAYFITGAKEALKLAQQNHCVAAILTERSPSCGSQIIYDGNFSGNRITGYGVTTALLRESGIQVFNQYQLEELNQFLIRG